VEEQEIGNLADDSGVSCYFKINLADIFEKFLDAVLIVDFQQTIIYANKKSEEVLGQNREDLIEKKITEILFGIDELFHFPRFYKENKKPPIEVIKANFKGSNELNKYLFIKIIPIIEGSMIIISDETEKQEIEQNLKECENKFREMVDLLPDIVFEINKQLIITYANTVAFEKFGYFKEEFEKGLNVLDMLSVNEVNGGKQILGEIFTGKITEPMEHRLKKKDGTEFYGLVHSSPIYENGQVVGIRGIISDISNRKITEEKLKESEVKFRMIAEQSFMGIAILQDDLLKYLNQKLADIFGYSYEEIKKWPAKAYINLIHLEDREKVVQQGRKKQYGDTDVITHYQFRGVKKSGETIWLVIYSESIFFENKPADLVTLIDITEKKKTEQKTTEYLEEIKKQNEKLKEMDKNKDEMLNIVAHELRTPLVSILGFAELLLEDRSNLSPIQIQNLKVIERNSQRLNQLIERILNINKMEMGKIQLKFEIFDLRQLIYNVIEELSFQIKQKLHNIIIKIPPKSVIKADKEGVHEVIFNLITNAIKYTLNRGNIVIETKKYGLNQIFSIKDNGIGISKEDLPHIFERFANINQKKHKILGDVKGIGLGLTICKKIIELHGGKLWAESEGENKGTTVTFEIPISLEDANN